MALFRRSPTGALEAVANAPVGTSVQLGEASGHILGTLVFEEAGDRWVEHLLDCGGFRVWVSIENFDRTVATQWTGVDAGAVAGGPDDLRIRFEAVDYRRSESGSASFASKGQTGVLESGSIDYVDFAADGGRRLGFERFGEIGARRRSMAVAGNCPSCGAPLAVDSTGRCTTCGGRPTVDVGQWDAWEISSGIDVSDRLRLR